MTLSHQIRLRLLGAMRRTPSFVLSEDALVGAILACFPVAGGPTRSEIMAQIRRAEQDGWIVSGRDPLGNLTWKLTSVGEAAANELQV